MIKRPDLRIDTQFFDDNLNCFNIPEAIRVVQSVDTQTFIKQGLTEHDSEQLTSVAIQKVQKIMSNHLFANFMDCWSKLKQFNNQFLNKLNGKSFSQIGGHKRQSPMVQNLANQDADDNVETRGILRQKILLHKLSGSQVDWLEEQRKNIKSRQILKAKSIRKSPIGETHLQRAKVLKQIVDKLKYGRNSVTNLIDKFDNKQQDEQMHYKLNRLQRLMEDVHYSSIHKGYATQRKKPEQQSFNKSGSNISQQLQMKLKKELADIKEQMEKIRVENERILREEEWKKSEINKMAVTKDQIKIQYQNLKEQINYLQHQKRLKQQNQLRMQQQLSNNAYNKQQYERQIAFLSQKLNEAEKQKASLQRSTASLQRSTAQLIMPIPNMKTSQTIRQISHNSSNYIQTARPMIQIQPRQLQRQPRQMIPSEPNPFGYSTFATSQKQSQTINWQQNEPVGVYVGVGNIDEEGKQSADLFACC